MRKRLAVMRRPWVVPLALVAPACAWVLAVAGSALVLMGVYSLYGSGATSLGPFTTSNYHVAFSFIHLYTHTLQIALIVTASALAIGIPVAFHMSVRSRRAPLLLAILLLPYLVGYIPRILAIRLVFGTDGLLGSLFSWVGLSRNAVRPLLFTDTGTVIGALYTQVPVMVVLVYLAIERIDRDIIAAAIDLGASTWRVLFTVIIPNALVGITAASILVLATVFAAYAEPSLLGGANGQLAATVIATRFEVFLDWGRGSALAFCALATIAAVSLAAMAVLAVVRRIQGATAH